MIDFFYAIAHTIKSFVGIIKIYLFSVLFKVKVFKVNKFDFKRNIFILGSGKSNEEIDRDEIKKDLKNSTSIGINFWIYNDYVPEIYFFEINGSDTYTWDLFCKILKIKKKEYQNTIFIIRDIEKLKYNELLVLKNFPRELKKNLYFSLDFDLGKGTLNRFNLTLKIAKIFFSFKNILPKSRGSLSSAFSLALHSKSKNIIFVGCDLTGFSYHLARDYISKKYNSLPKIKIIRQSNKVNHSTNDKNYGLPIISDVILYLEKYDYSNKNIFNINNEGFFSKYYKTWENNEDD
tara:strand:+ start:1657 stop:2529 length:873 start_codon:yes stop_codon:yes gene_type:complete